MVEGKESQNSIALPVFAPVPGQVTRLPNPQHLDIRHDILMAQHHPLRMPSRPRRVYQERQVLLRIQLYPPIPRRPRRIPYRRKVLESILLIPPLPHQDDPIQRHARLLRRLLRHAQARRLRHQRLRARILQLEGQLVGRVSRVGGGEDPARPVAAPYYGGGVDAVGGEEREHVASFPVPGGFESLAEVCGGGFYLRVGVGAVGVGVAVDDWAVLKGAQCGEGSGLGTFVVREGPVGSFEQEGPEVEIWDVDSLVGGFGGHGDRGFDRRST